MPIAPELQAKIDALPDLALRASIFKTLEIPREHRVSDEDIFEVSVTGYQMAKEQQARRHKWQESEVLAFIEYFRTQTPALYARFIHHEKDLRDKELRGVDEDELWFDDDLWWDTKLLAHKWLSGLEFADSGELVSCVRSYAQAHLI